MSNATRGVPFSTHSPQRVLRILLAGLRDSKLIAFDCDTFDGTQLFVIDAEGRNQRAISRGPFPQRRPKLVTRRQVNLFASNRTGRDEVWKLWLDTRRELQLTTHGGFDPFESFDGKTVYFSKFD